MVGLPVSLSGEEGPQAAEARDFVERLAGAVDVPVETYDERFTTQLAQSHAGPPLRRTRARRRTCSTGLPRGTPEP